MTADGSAARLRHLRRAADHSGVGVREVVLPTSRQLIAGRMRLHYLDWNGEGTRHVLFLHGGGLTAHTWDLTCLALRSDHHCLALDQRGHGDSEWSPECDYSIEAHVGDLEHFVDALQLRDFVLVGMSLGGLNAIEYAGRHADRLRGLVIVDVGPEPRPEGAGRVLDFVKADAELDSVELFVERAMQFNHRRDPTLLRGSLLNNLRRLPNGKLTWKYDRRPFPTFDWEAWSRSVRTLGRRLGRIHCPTLVIRGGESDAFSAQDADRLVAALPNAGQVTIRNAGHTVQGDNPADFVRALRNFLCEVDAT